MPYTVSSADLPEDVKKWPKHAQEIFVKTFNAVYERNGGKDEGPAGNAYAIAKRAAQLWMKKKGVKFEDGSFTEGEPPTAGRDYAFFGPISLEQLQAEMPEWIPLHREGDYYDQRYGQFTMTQEKMQNAVANFYGCANRSNAPVDAQVPIDTRHSGDGACGWLDAMKVYGPYLLGKPLWTSKGRDIVGNKLFRFISPLYAEQEDDVLIKEVTLTNRDFLKLPPVDLPIVLSNDIDTHLLYPIQEPEVSKMTEQTLDQMTESAWVGLDDGMKLDIYYRLLEYEEVPEELKALEKWTRAFINDLPNAAFAVIEPAYPSKTDNKNARHLPHHNKSVKKASEDSSVDISHYRNARARANQINPITDSISVEALRKRAWSHLEGHKGVLKEPEGAKEEIKQEATMPEETKVLEEGQANVQNLDTGQQTDDVKALEQQNKELKDRVLALERDRHEALVEKHITAAQKRGIPPIIVNLVKPVMMVCHEDTERIIALEAQDGKEAKANIFEMMVRLLEQCPTRLGEATVSPEGVKLDEKTKEGQQTVDARLAQLEEAMRRQYKELTAQGWSNLVKPPGIE